MISGHQEFFIPICGQDIFLPFFPISFLLHLCCTQIFFRHELAGIFVFKITHPSPSRVKWSAPNFLFFIFEVGLHILKAGVHVHVKATLTSLNTGVWKIPKSGIQNPAPEPEPELEPEPEPEK